MGPPPRVLSPHYGVLIGKKSGLAKVCILYVDGGNSTSSRRRHQPSNGPLSKCRAGPIRQAEPELALTHGLSGAALELRVGGSGARQTWV